MKYNSTKQELLYGYKAQLKCIVIFLMFLVPALCLIYILKKENYMIFQPLLFISGWFTWTFVEYTWHRFYTHRKTNNKISHIYRNHQYHHTHPTDIKVTVKQRIIMFCISAFFITISTLLNNYFTFLAGLWVGLNWFFLIHYFLHQTWAKKVFPNLLVFHIVHHCKNPDSCFCFSLTLWDKIFNTAPPEHLNISPRIIDFYFGEISTSDLKDSIL